VALTLASLSYSTCFTSNIGCSLPSHERLQASSGFTFPQSLDQYPVLSFERFDPVSALKSLGHPVSPAQSSNLISSTTLKRPWQSLFASAVSTVQEKDEKKMKASKGAES
jgi:hypothetical protein